ncbi:hypothetical protein MSAR_01820 [Mycolicibacterium sarraceniae]|uniref:GntR C-terminal domain-containing protein n=1 Tax=Mycolicibacterium sarraceniae TaxID=1534348 RepID=A0A7I7SMA6_9MYCO|nr:hypothetical protein MSAR_01820 [Mycolicibacterium sarraceniae]
METELSDALQISRGTLREAMRQLQQEGLISACQLTGNETLLHQWSSLEGSIRMSIMFAGVERAIKNMNGKRHHDIVDAIEAGDESAAAQAAVEHMAGAANNLVA